MHSPQGYLLGWSPDAYADIVPSISAMEPSQFYECLPSQASIKQKKILIIP